MMVENLGIRGWWSLRISRSHPQIWMVVELNKLHTLCDSHGLGMGAERLQDARL